MDKEIGTYSELTRNNQFENGVLTYLNEATYGEMRDLVRDIGINSDSLEFYSVADLQKQREKLMVHPSDQNFNYLMNALFSPLDMTDYESSFVNFNEISGSIPINNYTLLKPMQEEPWPANHALAASETYEKRPMLARNRAHRELLEAKEAEEEEEDEEEEEEEGEGEEGEGEEGEGEGEGAAEGEGEEEEEVVEEWPPKQTVEHVPHEDRYFKHGENLRNKFNEVELDSFIKLLNVKPYKQWEDTSVYHYKLGVHTYEDDSQ